MSISTQALTLIAATLCAGSAFAQSPELKFEAAAIKRIGGGGAPLPNVGEIIHPGGIFRDPGATLRFFIEFAYDIDDLGLKIVGLPAWAEDTVYCVNAKAGQDYPASVSPNQNKENVKAMLRAMLADRFQLKLHREDRPTDIWILQVKGDRPKIKPVSAEPPAKKAWVGLTAGDLRGAITGKQVEIGELARSLTMSLRQRVIDRTGLTGYYDFAETWGTPYQRGEPANANKLGPDGMAQLISVLDQNLGLTLKPEKAPVEFWVVDQVERPGEN